MRNIKIIIEYDGTNYNGWQIQNNAPSIQEEIQKAIYKISKEDIKLIGSGRTDAKVHARGQVANFKTKSNIPSEKFAQAINSKLKRDIVIKDSIEVGADFHSRYDAKSKIYSYTIYKSKYPPAIMRNYVYHLRQANNLDIKTLKESAKYFTGSHDFKAFMAANSNVVNTIRTIYDISLNERDDYIEVLFHGDGFLYNMIRIIMGTMLYVGIHKIPIHNLAQIIEKGDRELAGITLPAHALCLERVFY